MVNNLYNHPHTGMNLAALRAAVAAWTRFETTAGPDDITLTDGERDLLAVCRDLLHHIDNPF